MNQITPSSEPKKKSPYVFFIMLIILIVLGAVYVKSFTVKKETIHTNSPVAVSPAPIGNEYIVITSPLPNETIASPVQVSGKARGTWYFEASFPVEVVDQNGQVLGIGIAQAQGDWMTEEFVNFSANIVFSKPVGTTGKLIFRKDNPSGLPEHDKQFEIPIKFSTGVSQE